MNVLVAYASRHGSTAGDFREWPAIDAWTNAIAAELRAGEETRP